MTVIILRVEKWIFKAIVHQLEKPFDLFQRNIKLNEIKWFLTNMCCNIMTIVVLAIYFWQHIGIDKSVQIASVYLLIQYLSKISQLFFRFSEMYGEIVQQTSKVMNAEELANDFKDEDNKEHILPTQWSKLEIRNLNFSYHTDGNRDLHLTDISLTINRGERIAFVGDSGDGKTTLLKIIRELYQPQSSTILVDSVVIPRGFSGIEQAIALVPQNPEIFATTILENITLGAEHNIDLVREFTDMACFTEVVDKLPKKFDSSIKERGVNLSGGQQQRLALTRGLLACSDKDIVLLDEPTSSLDTGTEMKVFRNIFNKFRGKSIIASVHRLHLLPLFDCIYVFDKGRIVGFGKLNELLQTCPKLATAWKLYMDSEGN